MNEVISGVLIAGVLIAVVALTAIAGPAADRAAGDLRLLLAVGKATYRPGEPVAINLRVTNGGGEVALTVYSGKQYDFIVQQRGALIWQWSHDKGFAQVVRETKMAPGESLAFNWTWDQRDLQGRQVEPGTYEISAMFFGVQRGGPRSIDVGPVRITIGR